MSFAIHHRRRLAVVAGAALAAGALGVPAAASAHPTSGHQTQHGASGAGHHAQHAPRSTAPVVETASLLTGQYQSAYSERNHLLWVASAVGRPPVTNSALTAINPRTLAVEKTITPPVTDEATGGVEAVYGVAVDDEHNTVWVTNTRNNSVAVYSQRTGEHLATLPDVAHAREIVVDEKHDTAWVTANGDSAVVAYNTRTLTETRRITVADSSPAGLAVDERTGTAYATDLAGDQVIEITRRSSTPTLIPTVASPISISLSKNGKTAYTASQTDGLGVVDLKNDTLTGTVDTGAGSLSVATDPRSGKVLVANRTAAAVEVVNPRTATVTDTIATAANPNHVEFGGGSAWVLDKSGAGPNGEDTIYRITLH